MSDPDTSAPVVEAMCERLKRAGDPVWYHTRNEVIAGAAALLRAQQARIERLEVALRPFGGVAAEYERWQAKGSTTLPEQVRFGYGKCRFGLAEFEAARAALNLASEGE